MRNTTPKHITITPKRYPNLNGLSQDKHNGVTIRSTQENWQLHVDCQGDNPHEDLELSRITIIMPNGASFMGSIQDIMAIPTILKNAEHILDDIMHKHLVQGIEHANGVDSIHELNTLRKLFK